MQNLEIYAAIAEVFGAITIILGGLFAVAQIMEFRKRRRAQVAADLCREFAKPELARAVSIVRQLPDGITLEQMNELSAEHAEAAQTVGMTFETMGLLVHTDIASFDIVNELTGGLLRMMWRKIEVWVADTRTVEKNPHFGEWCQWLVERVQERDTGQPPAHIRYAGQSKHLN